MSLSPLVVLRDAQRHLPITVVARTGSAPLSTTFWATRPSARKLGPLCTPLGGLIDRLLPNGGSQDRDPGPGRVPWRRWLARVLASATRDAPLARDSSRASHLHTCSHQSLASVSVSCQWPSSDPSHMNMALTVNTHSQQSEHGLSCLLPTGRPQLSITQFLSVTTPISSISTGAQVQLLCITARPHGAAASAECLMRPSRNLSHVKIISLINLRWRSSLDRERVDTALDSQTCRACSR